jgi:hypothetical protein
MLEVLFKCLTIFDSSILNKVWQYASMDESCRQLGLTQASACTETYSSLKEPHMLIYENLFAAI